MLCLSSSTSLSSSSTTSASQNSSSSSCARAEDKVVKTRRHQPPSPRLPPRKPISLSPTRLLAPALPFVASVSILLCPFPVNAGILSGSSGLESMPGPQLPEIDFLKQWNEENQKKYAEFDSRFKSSTVLKEFLEKSRLNKERNRKEIQDKYCLRGAEWGVGDCSTQGMTQEERDEFLSMLKKKSGGE